MARERILVVDDNELNLKLIRALLVREGYEVESAPDAAAARRLLGSFDPQLVLLDVQLPDADGVEFARQLRTEPSLGRLVIVALTAYTSPGAEERAKAAGCNGYIPKPVDARTFPSLLRRYLDETT